MDSHKYANKLKQLADFLLSKPEFNTDFEEQFSYVVMSYFSNKKDFIAAVRALGSGKKEWTKDDVKYLPDGSDMLRMTVNRSAVCRLIQEAKYDCEPLLSQDEEKELRDNHHESWKAHDIQETEFAG